MITPFAVAIIAPMIWAITNILDKYLLSHKVKDPLSYAPVSGLANVLFGLIVASFLDWSGITLKALLAPVITGLIVGLQLYFYFTLYSQDDISYTAGFIFTYPLLVSLLSYTFLGETVSSKAYLGMFLVVIGTILLSLRARKIDFKANKGMIFIMIILVALYEFFIKVSTKNVSELQGTSVSMIVLGLVILPVIIHKNTRNGFIKELRNFNWAILIEFLTLCAFFCMFYTMTRLPATIVSSLSATQPIFIIIFERIAHLKVGRMIRHEDVLPKLIPIGIVVIGIILIYLS